jgi:hypothetical protein
MKHATMNAVEYVRSGLSDFCRDVEVVLPRVNAHFYAACTETPEPAERCIPLIRIDTETPSCPQCAVLLDEAWESQRSK